MSGFVSERACRFYKICSVLTDLSQLTAFRLVSIIQINSFESEKYVMGKIALLPEFVIIRAFESPVNLDNRRSTVLCTSFLDITFSEVIPVYVIEMFEAHRCSPLPTCFFGKLS